MDVIVTHVNTDFDAFASMLAARRLYPAAVPALSGSLNRNVRDFYRLHADELGVAETGSVDHERIRRLIVVETVHAERLGEFADVARREDVEVVAFDHHQPERPDWIPEENLVLSEDGSLTTTLVGILAERSIDPTPLEATTFALGIHEDTGSLTYPTVTQRDADALAWCLRHGARQEMVAHYLHAPLADDERGLLEALLAGAEPHEAAGFEVLVTAVAWPRYVDGVSNLVHKVIDLTDAPGLVALVEMDERVVVVARARVPQLDASALAARLGGGGHPQAASALFRGSLAEARERTLAALPDAVRRPLRARDVMSRPPHFVSPEDTVAHAMVACQRYRQSGIQVGSEANLVGVVTREDLDKAVAHGLAHAPAKSVMTSQITTCSEETPLAELRRLVTGTDVGRVPVVRGGTVVGVVTRSDVLRALEEPVEADVPADADLSDRLLAREHLGRVFEAVQAVSGPFEGVYLVGGAVRDVLMDEPSFDLDIAVEGDGVVFGRALARALGGRAVAHEAFGTAVVIGEDGSRVDVATTRTEFYDRPASLPRVERATLRQDLFRRDFTINAMAVSLKGEDFGRLRDFFGGLADLRSGVVRVLHNLSFIDDPTRIFRAIRYENRYGFRMDGHTAALARACVEMELVGELSSARLRDELQALLDEGDAAGALTRMHELGVAHAVHPHLAADEEAVALVRALDELRARHDPAVPRWRLRLAVLARKLPPDELFDWFGRLKLRRRDAERIADAVTVAPRLVPLLEDVEEPAEVRRLVAPHDPDGALLALVLASGRARERLERYFGSLRAVRLEIGGEDLAGLGVTESPRVGAILAELLRRKVNGELDGRRAELEAARELVTGS
ncbi:MAG: CBS domain-containing protein [Thermoleophilia bacterium]|nr:CBS domain-containing protein [Thermoleophilia bacterium]